MVGTPGHGDELRRTATGGSHRLGPCLGIRRLRAQLTDATALAAVAYQQYQVGIDTSMSKNNQKSNREIRKPKSAKPKAAVQASPFEKPQGMGMAKKGGGKKAR